MGKKGGKKGKKQEAAVEEPEEEIDWNEGTKKQSKKQLEREEKKREAAEKKKEREEALKAEESVNASSKKKGKGKKQARESRKAGSLDDALGQTTSISAEGLDNSLAALSLLNKDAVSNNEIDRHPERRFKAALAEYTERRLPDLRKENPGMRKHQLEELAYKEFQKSDENPFNKEVNVAYNATESDIQNKKDSIKQKRSKKYER